MSRQRNEGLYKRCDCPRRNWPKCRHAWWFSFKWKKGKLYRLSLDKQCSKHIDSKTDAEREADRLRTEIREGRYGTGLPAADLLTLRQLLKAYQDRKLQTERPERAAADRQIINLIAKTVVPHVLGDARPFGDWLVADVNADGLERFREARRARVAGNRTLAYLSAVFNWAIGAGHVKESPFKRGTVTVVKLTRELPRSRRLEPGEAEGLLGVAGPHLRALIEAALETGCRLGELLSLQWGQVRTDAIFLPAGKTKTKQDRAIPISARLLAVLEMRRLAPDGKEHPAEAYVFGNEIGQRVTSLKTAWRIAVLKSHGVKPEWRGKPRCLTAECQAKIQEINLHFHDLRREAGSRWLEGGVPIQVVRDWLGHSNVAQTSTYLASTSRTQADAMTAFDARRGLVKNCETDSPRGGRKSERTAAGAMRKPKKTGGIPVQPVM